MTFWEQVQLYQWWIAGGVILIGVLIGLYFRFRKHKHKFFPFGHFFYNERPVLFSVCKRCNKAVYQPIYSKKALIKFEEEMNGKRKQTAEAIE
jgi:hypothetical protein